MNTKLLIIFTCTIVCLCGCELGIDRVYMEMYEAMKANSDAIENGIESKISAMLEQVKRKPDYKALVPAAKEIEKLTSDFNRFINGLDEHLDEGNLKVVNDDEIKGEIIAHRQKIIETIKVLSSNKNLRVTEEEIQNLTELHFFPNGTLPLINGKPFDNYSFENQSIACNKAIFAKQKNDALILAKIAVKYLGGKIGVTALIFDKPMIASSPKKNFIIKGETFETDIFLYFPSRTSQLKMIIKVDGEEMPTKNGIATYKTTPTVYGEHRYVVKILVKNPFNNKFETYQRTFAFEVGERCY